MDNTPQLRENDGICTYVFRSLEDAGCINAVFARKGGVSTEPWASLNLGGTVGDDPAHVAENRRRSFCAVGRSIDTAFDVWQVHSADVVCTDRPRPAHEDHQKADAILTDRPEVTLFMRFADCVPVFLFDPMRRVVGLVHAGWPGTVKKTAAAAVQAMQAKYGTNPKDLIAAIGPSICVEHYPIGPDVASQVRDAFGMDAPDLLPEMEGQTHFDLWAANQITLERCGVTKIERSGLCTAHNVDLWYSHRAEKGRTGRFGAVIAIGSGNGWSRQE